MPAGITIIGLGPGSSQHWTQAAYARLKEAKEIYLYTTHHPSVSDISAKIYHFDELFKHADDINPLYNQIVAEIIRLGQRDEGVIYAVPGNPSIDDPTVPRIQTLAETNHIPVTIIPGLSCLEAVRATLKLDRNCPLQVVEATKIAQFHHPPLAPDSPALSTHLHHRNLATKIKQVLLNVYPDSFAVILVQATGRESEHLAHCTLSELDNQASFDLRTSLYLPVDNTQSSFNTFQETVAHLRAPEGCPWDREQTHQSLRPFLLEETYEVLEALDANDPAALAEELGDLLLQIALHAQIATDLGEFKMGEVIDQINRKLLRRHPHVFEDTVVNSVDEVVTNWEAIKKAEKEETQKGQAAEAVSALDGVPKALPALAQALSVSKRAVRVGFEWPNIQGVLDKLVEEAREVAEATDPVHLETEIGDLLFVVVNLARWKNIDPESALRATNARFTRRFKKLEALATAQNKTLPEMSLDKMEALWGQAKQIVG